MMAPADRRFGKAAMWLVWCVLGISAALLGAAPTEQAGIAPDVSAANWYWGPNNRWSWHNTRRIFPTAEISRGSGPAVPLAPAMRDLSTISFIDPVTKKPMTIAEMLDATYTDSFLVLQHGRILAESYRNGNTWEQPHLLMSVSKSVLGALAGVLIGRGELDPARLVTDYVPEMKGTVYEGATIRNLLDMSVDDPEARDAMKSTRGTAMFYEAVDEAGGWLPATTTSAPGLRSYLTGLRYPHGENGKQFLYLDQSAVLIGWVMERATQKDLSQLLSEDLWSKLGAEQDAYMLLDRQQQAYSSAGINMTLRDLGRFGVMMAQGGRYNGVQIVPRDWVEDIRKNGTAGDAGLSTGRGTHRSFWWLTLSSCGRFSGVGLGGQSLVIDPVADMVVVKFDSVPDPAVDGKISRTQGQGDRCDYQGGFGSWVFLTSSGH